MSLLQVDDLPALRSRLRDAGVAAIELDLSGCDSKATLMQRCAAYLQLPASFGHNWDALNDALREGLLAQHAQRGLGVVIITGSETLSRAAPAVVSTLQALLLELTTSFDSETCLAYWVAPASRGGSPR